MHFVRLLILKREDHWIQGFRSCKTIPGEEKVLVPGDPEREYEVERRRNGIPLLESVVTDLKELGTRFDIAFP